MHAHLVLLLNYYLKNWYPSYSHFIGQNENSYLTQFSGKGQKQTYNNIISRDTCLEVQALNVAMMDHLSWPKPHDDIDDKRGISSNI